jgi:hypothetical protein
LTREQPDVGTSDGLARLVRRSWMLDPLMKRHWLRVLPHLTPFDRARLREILSSEPIEAPPKPLESPDALPRDRS